MSRTDFFEQTRNALRALAVPFESRELYDYCEGMFPLREQERTPAGWALAFLAEQARPERQPAAAA
jgi:hypothetical protein